MNSPWGGGGGGRGPRRFTDIFGRVNDQARAVSVAYFFTRRPGFQRQASASRLGQFYDAKALLRGSRLPTCCFGSGPIKIPAW